MKKALRKGVTTGLCAAAAAKAATIALLSSDPAVQVEVKAKSGKSKSLRTLIDSDRYKDIHYGIKLAGGNIGYSGNIYTFPHFCSFLLKRYLHHKSLS